MLKLHHHFAPIPRKAMVIHVFMAEQCFQIVLVLSTCTRMSRNETIRLRRKLNPRMSSFCYNYRRICTGPCQDATNYGHRRPRHIPVYFPHPGGILVKISGKRKRSWYEMGPTRSNRLYSCSLSVIFLTIRQERVIFGKFSMVKKVKKMMKTVNHISITIDPVVSGDQTHGRATSPVFSP